MGSPRPTITLPRYLFLGSLAFLLTGIVIGLLAPAQTTFIGPAYRTLRFQIIDQSRSAPIAGARVALVHPYDPEQPQIEGMTDQQGRVELRGRFTHCGGGDTWRGSRVTFFNYGPWCVTVRADGFQEIRCVLGDPAATRDVPTQRLNLTDDAPSPIIVGLQPLGSRGP
jgi:hypothetical protein